MSSTMTLCFDGDMPRPRPLHLHHELTRHGRLVWYVRIDRGARIRIRGDYGSPEFNEAYQAAIAGSVPTTSRQHDVSDTLGWLIERYRESTAWSDLSSATRKRREQIFADIVKRAGRTPLSHISRDTIERSIESRNRFTGRHFLQAMRGLYAWAVKAKHVGADPTAELRVELPPTDGHHVWSEEEVAQFEAHWPRGTRERVALDVLLYTGLRRGDAVRLGRPHVKRGVATIRTEKTGQVVTIPILPPLQETIDAGPVGELTFIAGEHGRPMRKESFGTWFRIACKKAGVPGRAHGLRKCGATRAANAGATDAMLEAMYGWARGSKEAATYTRNADRARLASAGARLLLERHLFPHLSPGCGSEPENIKQINGEKRLKRSRQDSNL